MCNKIGVIIQTIIQVRNCDIYLNNSNNLHNMSYFQLINQKISKEIMNIHFLYFVNIEYVLLHNYINGFKK